MLTVRYEAGFTLVEMMITMSISALLLVIGMPALSDAVNNAKVRSAAEVLQNGLRNAQSEAVRRSRQTAFVLTAAAPGLSATPAVNGGQWYAQVLPLVSSETIDSSFYVEGGTFGNQTTGVTVTGPAIICFNSIGRVVANASTGLGASCDPPQAVTTFDVTKPNADRVIVLQVSASGKIRMCDKSRNLATDAPDGC